MATHRYLERWSSHLLIAYQPEVYQSVDFGNRTRFDPGSLLLKTRRPCSRVASNSCGYGTRFHGGLSLVIFQQSPLFLLPAYLKRHRHLKTGFPVAL